ncbi:MAG TPA: acetylornithine/succinylornithine family transaminase [Candidatus Krumholzibacteria bacterium]|nr:acetylornithine/succinylornithine family transaminase [Candidatus Krumholzibacteria bacterium]
MKTHLDMIRQQESQLLVPTYDRVPVLFERGEGVHLFDSEGRRYVDFLSGIGVNALGHGHPAIQAAIAAQAGRLIHVSNLFFHEHQARLAAKLAALSGLDRAFFCNSGTEAWECALKLARAYGRHTNSNGSKPKSRLVVMTDSFHGRTLGSLATTGNKKYRAPFAPMLPGVTFVKFNDVADLESKFDHSVCAVGLETIQGEGGVNPVSREFLARARALTREAGALLILDEIQCGLGRTGAMFAYQKYGVVPDVVTVAKPLAAGLPLGAVLATHAVAAAFRPGMHGTTFGGGPLACAAAIAFLDEIAKPEIREHVATIGDYFRERLLALKSKHRVVVDVRGVGLMLALELESADQAKSIVNTALARGYVINRTHDTVLRFLPPYIIAREHVDGLVAVLDELLSGGSEHE